MYSISFQTNNKRNKIQTLSIRIIEDANQIVNCCWIIGRRTRLSISEVCYNALVAVNVTEMRKHWKSINSDSTDRRSPYPDTQIIVGICHACKQMGHFPLYLLLLGSRFGGSGTGRFVKLPWLASVCHHWINCKKNADNSNPRKMMLVRTAECLRLTKWVIRRV